MSFIPLILGLISGAGASAVEFRANGPFDTDFGWQKQLPADFGRGEFTLDVRFRADDSFPIGPTRPQNSPAQRKNWAEADLEPYSDQDWWYQGNFLLDGHNNDHASMGTFGLQFYGGGRLRWFFGDGDNGLEGGIWSIGAYPATETPSLLDGEWHWASTVRRFAEGGGADLELWIDGERVAMQHSPQRTDMQSMWGEWTGFTYDSIGWFWGGERQVASRTLEQYEDFKGEISEVRFWSIARTPAELATVNETPQAAAAGLVGLYAMPDDFGEPACNQLTGTECIEFKTIDDTWQFGQAKLSPIDWLLAALALVGAVAAGYRGFAARNVARPAFLAWGFAAAVLAATAVFTLLDLPTLFGQTVRVAAHAQGWYTLRKPIQIAAIVVVALALGQIARRLWSPSIPRGTRLVAVAAMLLVALLLVRSASWHVTDTILELGSGPFTLDRVAELLASLAILAIAFTGVFRRATQEQSR